VTYLLFHRVADAESARVRQRVVELGLKPRISFENVDSDGAEAFAAHGGGAVPALWDGTRLHRGTDAIFLALAAIMSAVEQER